MDAITAAVSGLTDRIAEYRVVRKFIQEGFFEMPLIEIKGLAASIATAKKGIAEVRGAAASLGTETTGLVAELNEVTSQVKQHRADLRFEAETLGNSNGSEETLTSSDVQQLSAAQLSAQGIIASPEVPPPLPAGSGTASAAEPIR